MKKRNFLKVTAFSATGLAISPLFSACDQSGESEENANQESQEVPEEHMQQTPTFTLPELPYPYDALQPNIDQQTMEIHHTKHHAGYVSKLNKALENSDLNYNSLEGLLMDLPDDNKYIKVRQNGGGHFNHSLFWKVMAPNPSATMPEGNLMKNIEDSFDTYDAFKEAFQKEAGSVFGSGWAWLIVDRSGSLKITSTPNQDNPLMINIAETTGFPILGIDVWEHAYYLKYQNQRKKYIDNWFNIINWEQVAENYQQSLNRNS